MDKNEERALTLMLITICRQMHLQGSFEEKFIYIVIIHISYPPDHLYWYIHRQSRHLAAAAPPLVSIMFQDSVYITSCPWGLKVRPCFPSEHMGARV